MAIDFNSEFDPRHGEMVEVSPLLRRIVCANESKYTFRGTGTYVIGRGTVAIVDPGPDDAAHIDALLHALRGESVSHILITHTHGDHSPGAGRVAAATGARVLGFGPHPSGADNEGADPGPANGAAEAADEPNHSDIDFAPDQTLSHGDVITGAGWTVEALHTPGHISNHLCFALREEGAVLSGDHVMGWSTTIIPPPDGSVADYLSSLRLLLDRDDGVLYPTHGSPIHEPRAYVATLLQHRLDRETQIRQQIATGPQTAAEIVSVLYAGVRPELHKPAARSVLAHLHKLLVEGEVELADGADPLSADSVWLKR